ncbi:site-specific integrase [Streptococcus pluranimalium]|uniref:site-specific integrase n=1 Tax=Streptococcus pluranimalium TaxID=82348 RepID=UPI003F66D808
MSISLNQRGKKKEWSYRVFDKKGKLIATASGFRTKKEAELEALGIELKSLSGAKMNSYSSLFSLWEDWFELNVKPLAKSDATLYKHKKRGAYIYQFFGDTPATQIKFSQYQRVLNEYAEKVTKDTVRRFNAEVRKVIQFAQRDKIEITDFTEGAIISGKKKEKADFEKHIDNIADVKKILAYFESEFDYQKSVIPYYLYLSFQTGMRFGELLGITWDCIDWKNSVIHTYRRYDSTSYQWRPPKTATSVRAVPVNNKVMQVLKRIKQEQKLVDEKYHIKKSDDFVFYDKFYGVPTNNAVNKYLRNSLVKNNIQPTNLSVTGIRHTYASFLLAHNVDIWVVANVMGHKDIKQVTETYGHLLKEKKDKGHELIRGLLK